MAISNKHFFLNHIYILEIMYITLGFIITCLVAVEKNWDKIPCIINGELYETCIIKLIEILKKKISWKHLRF